MDHTYLNITGQVLLQGRQSGIHLTANLHGIGTGLLLDNHHGTLDAVVVRLLSTLLSAVHNLGQITQIYVTSAY